MCACASPTCLWPEGVVPAVIRRGFKTGILPRAAYQQFAQLTVAHAAVIAGQAAVALQKVRVVGTVQGGFLPDGLGQLVHRIQHLLLPLGQGLTGSCSPVGVLAQGLAVALHDRVDVVGHACCQRRVAHHLPLRGALHRGDLLRGQMAEAICAGGWASLLGRCLSCRCCLNRGHRLCGYCGRSCAASHALGTSHAAASAAHHCASSLALTRVAMLCGNACHGMLCSRSSAAIAGGVLP